MSSSVTTATHSPLELLYKKSSPSNELGELTAINQENFHQRMKKWN